MVSEEYINSAVQLTTNILEPSVCTCLTELLRTGPGDKFMAHSMNMTLVTSFFAAQLWADYSIFPIQGQREI